MKKKIQTSRKRLLSVLLAVAMVLTALPLTALSALAATSGDFEYEVLSETDKTCEITDYTGSATTLSIPQTLDGYSVTSIGRFALADNTALTSVTLPNSVTELVYGAFLGCTALTDVQLPSTLKSIGECAFGDCVALEKLNLPDGIEYIGRGILANTAYAANDANRTNHILYCGNYLLEAAQSLSGDCAVKAGTVLIAERAFEGCSALTGISIPDSVTSIGMWAFEGCTSLATATLGSGVTNINSGTFYYCKALTSITIPNNVTEIGDWAFHSCTSLASITIPDSVTSLGDGAFAYCSALTSITIPNSVTSIDSAAFQSCTSLASITIPDSVTKIGGDVFSNTAYYNDDTHWENDVLYIGNHLIEAKNTLSGAYTVRAGTKTIAGGAFSGCETLARITIPDSVMSIGGGSFSNCLSLASVNIPNGVISIGGEAFFWCLSLKSITIPNSVISIGDGAFYGCVELTSVVIPNSVTSVDMETFGGCTSLTSVTIPNSVTSIAEDAFYDSGLTTIYGYTGSYAETFASKNGYPFVPITPDGALRLDLPTSGIIGQQVQIPIVLEDVALGALNFTLQYDQTKLEFVSCTQNAFKPYSVNSNVPGQIKYGGVTATSVQPGQVMVLTFNVIADEECGTAVSLNVTAACADDIDSTELNLIGGTWNLPLKKELTGISIYTAPTKTSYYIGDSLNTSGLQVQLTYSDNSTQVISTGFAISTFDSSTAGTKTITVTYGGKTASFTATVKTPTLTVSKSSTEMLVGDTETLTVSTDPSNQTVHWSSTNTNVVTVSNGKLTAVGAGTATVTAKFVYNGQTYSKNCEVTVQEPVPDGALRLDLPTSGIIGQQVQIPIVLEDVALGALDFTLQYDQTKLEFVSCTQNAFTNYSVNSNIPGQIKHSGVTMTSVQPGQVMVLTFNVIADEECGTAVSLNVTAACTDDIDSTELNLIGGTWNLPLEKELTGISIYTAPTKTSYYIGDSLNTSGLQVQLTYSDNSTQVISTGFAISAFDSSTAGTKTITVTYGGKSASFTATVKAPTLTVSKSSTEMLVGDTETLTVSTDPSNQTVHWSSTNTNVVTVSNGKLTAVGTGTATVTAKFVYNGQTYSKNCEVTVQEPVPDGALYIETPRGFVGKQVQIPVYLEGADVGALTFTVQYDTQKLQYISCSDMAFGMCSENNSTPGTVVFACIDNGVISAGKVCILTFEVVADTNTQTDIALSVSEACNDDNHPLYVTGGSWSMEIMKAIPGDVNDDGKITAVDARYVLQAASGARSLDEIQKIVADINGDGRISAVDARWILQVASGVRTL